MKCDVSRLFCGSVARMQPDRLLGSVRAKASDFGWALSYPVLLGIAALQEPGPRPLGPLISKTADSFSRIGSIRELSGERVLVLDSKELAIQLVDWRSGKTASVGRLGAGPGEYRAPLKLLPLPGDGTALIDMAAFGQVLVIGPGGERRASIAMPRVPNMRYPDWTDQSGRLYAIASREGKTAGDSANVIRWGLGDRVDTVAALSLSIGVALRSSGPGPAPPFSVHDEWSVAADGRVAVVSPRPYRVTYYETGAERKAGPVHPVEPVAVTEGHKREWLEEAQRPTVALVSVRGGPLTTTWLKPPFHLSPDWPRYLPPFLPGSIWFAPDGMLWVQRTTSFGALPVVDVLDRNGAMVDHIQIPRRSRLLGFGASSVYLARLGDEDLERLERYSFPTLNRRDR
jgi:hypothetical protein